MNILLGILIFIFTLLIIELTLFAYHTIKHPDRAEIRRRLRQGLNCKGENVEANILKNEIFSEVPFINRILAHLPVVERLQLMINQANINQTLGFLMLFAFSLSLTGYFISFLITNNHFLSFPVAAAVGAIPFFYVQVKKNKRMAKFEKQLPEALDLIARALRAGHAFSSGMKFAAEEFRDPLGPYFEETLEEINFGVSMAEALKHLTIRVDCPDLKFFVVSVILQRETGGNLAEIIEGLAHLIRARFKFRGKIRTLSSEGRLTGKILVVIPIILFICIYALNKEYAAPLIFDPIGRFLVGMAFCMMIFAWLVIKRIISLDV